VVREVPLRAIKLGMTFVDDVRMANGTLLVPRGFVVTPAFLERARHFDGNVREPLKVLLGPGSTGESGEEPRRSPTQEVQAAGR
jgi:hypothetical protein